MSFDLSGLLHIQKTLVTNLSGNTNSASTLTDIGNKLNDINSAYDKSISNTQGLLSQQNTLNSILDTENTRLINKKKVVDEEVTGRRRIVDLNESYRKKQAQYVYIIIILIFALLLYIMIVKIKTFIPVVPDSVIDLLTFFLGALTCLYLYVLIKDIYSRDNMNYDQLNLPAPSIATDEETLKKQRAAAAAGDLIGSVANPNTCVGESCCVDGVTVYEPGIGKCIKKCPVLGEASNKKLYDTSNNSCVVSPLNTSTYKLCGNVIIPKTQTCFIEKAGFTTLESNITKPYEPSQYVNYSKI